MSHVDYELRDALAVVTLTNPPQNRISEQMARELDAAVRGAAAAPARALLLRADGPDFCMGGDIEPWPDIEPDDLRSRFETYMAIFNRFEQLPIPTVTAAQGRCLGGGLELAVRSDVILAAESARFGHPEGTLGIGTLLGGVYRVAERAGRARAIEWAMTSEQVSAEVMAQAGVVNRVVTDDDLLTEATAFATKLAAGPTRAHAAHKALLRAWAVGGVAAADEVMFDVMMPLFATDDVRRALPAAVEALRAGRPRPTTDFHGR